MTIVPPTAPHRDFGFAAYTAYLASYEKYVQAVVRCKSAAAVDRKAREERAAKLARPPVSRAPKATVAPAARQVHHKRGRHESPRIGKSDPMGPLPAPQGVAGEKSPNAKARRQARRAGRTGSGAKSPGMAADNSAGRGGIDEVLERMSSLEKNFDDGFNVMLSQVGETFQDVSEMTTSQLRPILRETAQQFVSEFSNRVGGTILIGKEVVTMQQGSQAAIDMSISEFRALTGQSNHLAINNQ